MQSVPPAALNPVHSPTLQVTAVPCHASLVCTKWRRLALAHP